MEIIGLALLGLFVVASVATGAGIVTTLVKTPRGIVWGVSSVILGFFVSVWAVYILSWATGSQKTGLILFDIFGLFVLFKLYHRRMFAHVFPVSPTDALVLVSSIAVSFWIMFKPFHNGTNGMLLIGTNEVFDYGHALSVIRSFSQGANIPYSSPFIAGTPHVYHFLFYFWAGLLERFGMSIVWAFNLPSIVALAAVLMMAYFLARYFFKTRVAGVLAMYFALTHSTLMFWYFLRDPKNFGNPIQVIWTNASYYFAGPFDGSPISIFWTLNVVVNQRHLVFGLSVVFVLYFMVLYILDHQKKSVPLAPVIIGVLTGILLWWHLTLFLAAVLVIGTVFLIRKHYKAAGVFILSSMPVAFVQAMPWLNRIPGVRQLEGEQALLYYFLSPDLLSWFRYWWLNLGVALVTIPIGFFILPKNKRTVVVPFLILFIFANFVRLGGDITENHKFINLVFLMGSILSAGFVSWCMKRKTVGLTVAASAIVLLSFSGIINLMVLKNDFQYPVADYQASALMRWTRDKTNPESVFLSYQDIFDPVALAGRKTYFGFFGAKAYPDRAEIVKAIYEATNSAALSQLDTNNIDYLVIPKWKKDDFSYVIDEVFFRNNLTVAYEDENNLVFAVR